MTIIQAKTGNPSLNKICFASKTVFLGPKQKLYLQLRLHRNTVGTVSRVLSLIVFCCLQILQLRPL
jgi:hypothetical protein